jgi:hypothetical protein
VQFVSDCRFNFASEEAYWQLMSTYFSLLQLLGPFTFALDLYLLPFLHLFFADAPASANETGEILKVRNPNKTILNKFFIL